MDMTELMNYAYVIITAERNYRVRRLIEPYVYTGTARAVLAASGAPAGNQDVSELYLRVTLDNTGVEVHWLLSELAAQHGAGEFMAIDDGLTYTRI